MEYNEIVALVTGGATGIGLGCAKSLARRGCRVAINNLGAEHLDSAVNAILEIPGTDPGRLMTIQADVTNATAVEAMFKQVEDKWGTVTALVNNAAISGGRISVKEITEEMWDTMMQANLRGLFMCTKRGLSHMYENKWGRIINISSIAGVSGKLYASAHYAATKGGVVAFTKRVSMEAAPFGVAVNCIAPGLILGTGFTCKIQGELLERYLSGIPAGRGGTCEEAGELAAFLCGPHAGYIIGQTIMLDGGVST